MDKIWASAPHTKTRDNIGIDTCVRKYSIRELQPKVCMLVLRYILAALCEMFSVTPIMADG
jgi:hypothetical protein